MEISVKNLSKVYKRDKNINKVLDNINFDVEKGEFVCVLGPSGCGKSTLLNIMAAFEKPSNGEVIIEGKAVQKPSVERVTIFQDYGLLPWRNVEKNVELGLESLKISKEKRKEISSRFIDLVGLTNFKKHHPNELSGGMKQRVAIARALAVSPKVLFMDEPFGALDPIIRMKMQEDIIKIWQEENTTIVFVTHDVDEAVYLADKIIIMEPNPGRVKKIIKSDLVRNRDKNSEDFIKLKNTVLKELGVSVEDMLVQVN